MKTDRYSFSIVRAMLSQMKLVTVSLIDPGERASSPDRTSIVLIASARVAGVLSTTRYPVFP